MISYWNLRTNLNGYYLVELYSRGSSIPLFVRSFSDRDLALAYYDLMKDREVVK